MQKLVLEILALVVTAAALVIAYRHAGRAVMRLVRNRLSTRSLRPHPVIEAVIVAFWPIPLAVLVIPPTVRYVADDLRQMGIAAVDGTVAAFGAAARAREAFALRGDRPRAHHGRDVLKTRLTALRERESAASRESTRRREDLPCTQCACSKSVTHGRLDVLRRRIAVARADGRLEAVRSAGNRVEAAIFTYHGRLAIMQRVL